MKLPQLLLSMWSVRNITSLSRTDVFSSPIRPIRSRNFFDFLHSRNLLLSRNMRILISQWVPVLNVRGEHLPGVTKHRNHPAHHLLSLLHTTEIGILSQQHAKGCWCSYRLCRLDRCIG